VALEAIREELTLAELSTKHGVHMRELAAYLKGFGRPADMAFGQYQCLGSGNRDTRGVALDEGELKGAVLELCVYFT